MPDLIRNDNAEESKAAPHPNENNSKNEKIINLGCHVQVIHLKPHKILTHMLIDFLIL